MEHQAHPIKPDPELRINPITQSYLLETAKWGKFLAIMGYIAIGLMLLVGLLMLMVGSSLSRAYAMPGGGAALFMMYLFIAAIYIYPVYALMRFSKLIRYALLNADEDQMTEAFGNLKSIFKFMGILTIAMLCLYAVAIAFAIIVGVTAGLSS